MEKFKVGDVVRPAEQSSEEESAERCKYCKRANCQALRVSDNLAVLKECRHATRLERDFLANRVGRVESANAQLKTQLAATKDLTSPGKPDGAEPDAHGSQDGVAPTAQQQGLLRDHGGAGGGESLEKLAQRLEASEAERAKWLLEVQQLYEAFRGSGHSPKNPREAAQAIGQMVRDDEWKHLVEAAELLRRCESTGESGVRSFDLLTIHQDMVGWYERDLLRTKDSSDGAHDAPAPLTDAYRKGFYDGKDCGIALAKQALDDIDN